MSRLRAASPDLGFLVDSPQSLRTFAASDGASSLFDISGENASDHLRSTIPPWIIQGSTFHSNSSGKNTAHCRDLLSAVCGSHGGRTCRKGSHDINFM